MTVCVINICQDSVCKSREQRFGFSHINTETRRLWAECPWRQFYCSRLLCWVFTKWKRIQSFTSSWFQLSCWLGLLTGCILDLCCMFFLCKYLRLNPPGNNRLWLPAVISASGPKQETDFVIKWDFYWMSFLLTECSLCTFLLLLIFLMIIAV